MEWRNALEPIIRQAGNIICSYYQKPLERQEKHNAGFVTRADFASEQYLITQLSNLIPEASFCTEESGISEIVGNNEYCWVIDPLDGTTNFASGIPYFCISVALLHREKPIVGITYQPLTDELFYAEANKGTYYNGTKMTISPVNLLDAALISIGLSYCEREKMDVLHATERVAQKAFTVRHFGAIALDLAYCAVGRINGVFFTDLAWWDVAAGIVLIEQAGGVVTDFSGERVTKEYNSCIAANPTIHQDLKKLLEQ